MKNYSDYTVEQFLEDDSFRRWVFARQEVDIQFWEQYQIDNPQQRQTIEQARQLLLTVRGDVGAALPEDAVQERTDHLLRVIEEREAANPTIVRALGWQRWRVAASVALLGLLGLGWVVWQRNLPTPTAYETLVRQSSVTLQEVVNTGKSPRLVNLTDGSSVVLQPQSRLSFPGRFSDNRREVYLTGEAFFEVAKHAEQPFYVYANELVTKVLGTSFTVRAFGSDRQVRVIVKTGRVSVFARTDAQLAENLNKPALGGLVLLPNQQATLHRESMHLTTRQLSPVISPAEPTDPTAEGSVPTPLPVLQQSFEFRRTPLAEVFGTLERAYGVQITFDAAQLAHCSLTASLTDEPLSEKLDVIAQSMELDIQMTDNRIVVTGLGCE